jgi:hypothetical protein
VNFEAISMESSKLIEICHGLARAPSVDESIVGADGVKDGSHAHDCGDAYAAGEQDIPGCADSQWETDERLGDLEVVARNESVHESGATARRRRVEDADGDAVPIGSRIHDRIRPAIRGAPDPHAGVNVSPWRNRDRASRLNYYPANAGSEGDCLDDPRILPDLGHIRSHGG